MSAPPAASPPAAQVDRLTLLAIGLTAYAVTNVAHEGLGHGGACLLAGGKPAELNAIYFQCDKVGLGPDASRWISAGGTLVNLALAALLAAALPAARRLPPHARYFLWLLMTLSLLQATGYWLFSGIGNIGDWAAVVEGWEPAWGMRAALALAGTAGYVLSIRFALRTLAPQLGRDEGRVRTARLLTLMPYLAGGLLYIAAGLLNPRSLSLVLISAAAASFGGASALSWMASLLSNRKRFPEPEAPPLVLERSLPWLAVGVVSTLVFIVVLGRSVQLG